jgi:hypothetical protein
MSVARVLLCTLLAGCAAGLLATSVSSPPAGPTAAAPQPEEFPLLTAPLLLEAPQAVHFDIVGESQNLLPEEQDFSDVRIAAILSHSEQ